MQGDFRSHAKVVQSIKAASYSAGTTNGSSADTNGFAEAVVFVNVGTGTTGTLDVKIQDCNDNASWADLTGATFTQVNGTTGDETTYVARIRLSSYTAGTTDKCERYIRAVGVVATAAVPYSVDILLHTPLNTGVALSTMSFNID